MSAAKKRGLGRGLDALLGPKGAVTPVSVAAVAEPQPGEVLRKLQIDLLQPGKYQPRREMDEAKLSELSESIKAQGVIQPILVRQVEGGRYEIVAGERRWRASRLAGLDEVPVVVRELEDRTVIAMALIENIQREDLNPLEEAEALQRLISEFSLTHAEAAQAVGRSRASVSNLLRLIDLPAGVRVLLESRRLEMGHARALLTLAPELATKLAQDAADEGWSVREVEHRAQQFAAGKVPGARKARPAPSAPQADIASLETELSESLGTKVAINHGRGGKGKLVIHYTDLDTLDGVLERLRTRQHG
ncbi:MULTISPECIES: ParB/RepB/Spo0J family partition protein [Stenotrophomonas]|jgi:ParB family chromosome partitioning protein|uniref:Probable chromosome-partitioning protein ParB n=1 Tax=Stenotrophomonas acidaminiphila TaxID=128780 RepID=A0A0R0DQZ8_9GAMM|nr:MULTISPECIES: ParB/RepB/Spo0J family partition protein [Stenotrophomonas]OZB52747.1 MAG: chromosome partitioning protein ParB [Stenotrophomonas sp. 14-69-23]ALJ29949.1 chromosome partitioning protein [Stenotrophomonas acidaminiphila]KRG83910.1 chromosome partitioning protein ParB [Stenotrophomonas acidaminiphila]MCA7023731.1 ParB/RepB/Spo0J family partition protein [Stenotrophomonas acidaminiphila]MCE4074292.1 ParB/RepB/Spo0J family partition protein [Stenotrophomonas acidaminiphila]